MRYLGSKTNLLGEIREMVQTVAPSSHTFCDIFAGTGVVGREFKTSHRVTANDILYFSYVMNVAYTGLKEQPKFLKLVKEIGLDPIDFLNGPNLVVENPSDKDFMYTHFSPEGSERRQYLSAENALRIDRIRQTLDLWHEHNLIIEEEKHYLLCSLIEEVPSVSNTTGTYGAYLKHWDRRALKPLTLRHLAIEPTREDNEIFNADANDLIHKISGDVLYVDTPYNGRQYSKNYHLLETLARYDNPEIRGVTGLRADSRGDSQYCKRASVYESFDSLVGNADFKTVILSYSSDGLLSEEQLVEILTRHGRASSLNFKKIPYRRYKRASNDQRSVLEYLIAVNK
jgi:adenine-specific DNA-methyltransferase